MFEIALDGFGILHAKSAIADLVGLLRGALRVTENQVRPVLRVSRTAPHPPGSLRSLGVLSRKRER